jgi:hypothetical protein
MADRLAILAVALLSSAAAVSAGSPPVGEPLLRFTASPGLLGDATFSPAGDSLFLVDSKTSAIHICDLQGRCTRTVKRPGLGELDFNQPGTLVPWSGGFLLDSANLRLLWLDPALSPRQGWILPNRSAPPDAKAVASDRGGTLQEVTVWQAVPIGDQAAIVTGDYLDAKGWRHGVARLQGGDPLRLTVLSERRVDDPHYLYEIHQRPNLVTLGDAVYELRFGEVPSVERILPAAEHMALPKPFDAPLPPLTGMGGRNGYLRLFAKLRTVPLPAAIQGWRNGLCNGTSGAGERPAGAGRCGSRLPRRRATSSWSPAPTAGPSSSNPRPVPPRRREPWVSALWNPPRSKGDCDER